MTTFTIIVLALVVITAISYHAWSLRNAAFALGAVTLFAIIFNGGIILGGILILLTLGLALLSIKT